VVIYSFIKTAGNGRNGEDSKNIGEMRGKRKGREIVIAKYRNVIIK
jgi:hypothetical protein